MRAVLLIGFASAVAWGAGFVTEIIRPSQADPAALVRTLRPFLAPGGAIDSFNDKLLIKTTPENLRELKRLMGEVDHPARKLRFRIARPGAATGDASHADVSGAIAPGNVKVRGGLKEAEQKTISQSGQELVATDGQRSWISAGSGGFYVTPRLTRDGSVTLEVDSSSVPPGSARVQDVEAAHRISTTVRAPLGKWMNIGDTVESSRGRSAEILSRDHDDSAAANGVRIRVDALDQ